MGSSPILSIIENIEPGVVILNNDLSVSHINRMFLLMFSHFKRERLFEGKVLDFHDEEIRRKDYRDAAPDQGIEAADSLFP